MRAYILILLLVCSFAVAIPVSEKDIKLSVAGETVKLEHPLMDIQQYPEVLGKGKQASLTLNNKDKIKNYDICFDFPRDNNLIVIKPMVKKNFLFDSTYTDFERKDNSICLNDIPIGSNENFLYELDFLGRGTMKYNVTMIPNSYLKDYKTAYNDGEIIILDPYVVGDLGDATQSTDALIYRIKFDGNIIPESTYTASALTSANTRKEASSNGITYSGSCTNPQNVDDNNEGTYMENTVSCPVGSYGGVSCTVEMFFNVSGSDTGGYLEYSDFATESNISITDECFFYYPDTIKIAVVSYGETYSCGFACCAIRNRYVSWYCWNGNSYTQLAIDNGGDEAYETDIFLTNQTSFVAYTQVNHTAEYFLSTVSDALFYDFVIYNTPFDFYGGNNNGTSSGVVYNNSAAFDGVNDYINTTFKNNRADITDLAIVTKVKIQSAQEMDIVNSINLSANPNNTSICFQETATTTTSCGGLSTGIYKNQSFGNSYLFGTSNCYDGDYSLSSNCGDSNASDTSGVYFLINYTIPSNTNAATWLISDYFLAAQTTTNNTIPSSCLTYNGILQLRGSIRRCSPVAGGCTSNTITWSCNDGTWQTIRNLGTATDSEPLLMEEAIYWNISASGYAGTKIECSNNACLFSGANLFNCSFGTLNNNTYYVLGGLINSTDISCYKDGALIDSQARGTIRDNSSYYFLGVENSSSSKFLKGSIAMFQLYNSTLYDYDLIHLTNQYMNGSDNSGSSNKAFSNNEGLNIILASNLTSSQDYSISLWIKMQDTNINDAVIFETLDKNISLREQNSYDLNFYDGSSLSAVNNISLLQWMHIVALRDGTSKKLYVNNVLVNSGTATSSLPANAFSLYDRPGNLTNNDFYGSMDELMIFNYALTEQQIATLYNGFNTSINIRFYNEESQTDILPNTALDLISDSFSESYLAVTGSLLVNGFPSGLITLRYSKTGYDERFYFVNNTNNEQINLSLFLLPDTNASTITFTVLDNTNDKVSDAYVRMLRYNIDTNAYQVVEMAKTNQAGEAVFHAVLNSEFYQFLVYYPFSTLVGSSTPAYLRSTTPFLQVNLVAPFGENFEKTNDIVYSLAYNNATNNFRLEFSNVQGADTTITLEVYEFKPLSKTLINSSTITSSAGTVLVGITPTNNTQYTAQAVVHYSDGDQILSITDYIFPDVNPFGYFGLGLVWLLTIVAAFSGIYSIPVAVISVTLVNLIAIIIGILPPTLSSVSVGLVIASFILVFMMTRD